MIYNNSASGKGILKKDDKSFLSKNDNLNEYRNVKDWKDIRKEFLEGKNPKCVNSVGKMKEFQMEKKVLGFLS